MHLTLLKAKLHRAVITQTDMNYEGSLSIDAELMARAGILPNEQIDVANINNGARFTTYAIEAPAGSRIFGVNGAAARLAQKGDRIIVMAYASMPAEEARQHQPIVVLLNDDNEPI
jgi:aspartate 1-decarboxylase